MSYVRASRALKGCKQSLLELGIGLTIQEIEDMTVGDGVLPGCVALQ
jgi:hypothetical protein